MIVEMFKVDIFNSVESEISYNKVLDAERGISIFTNWQKAHDLKRVNHWTILPYQKSSNKNHKVSRMFSAID
jgi:hypothetical protein